MLHVLKTQRTGFLMGLLAAGLALAFFIAGVQAARANPGLGQEGPAPDPAAAPAVPAAPIGNQIPVQGRLTDASGAPLSGNYDITFNVYNTSVGGSALCTNAVTNVPVANGLFNHVINGCAGAAYAGDQLYVGIQVNSDPEMTPRLEILPVAHAMTVKPGAVIKGAGSHVFLPGINFVPVNDTHEVSWLTEGPSMYFSNTAGSNVVRYVRLPLNVPAVLYGQPVRLSSVRVYYRTSNALNAKITRTRIEKLNANGTISTILSDVNDRNSINHTFYVVLPDPALATLSSEEGLLTLLLDLSFANTSEYIRIYGVRLFLEHDF